MMVLSRRESEVICIGDDIRVTVQRIRGEVVALGVEAPREIRVDRAEVRARRDAEVRGESPDAPAASDGRSLGRLAGRPRADEGDGAGS